MACTGIIKRPGHHSEKRSRRSKERLYWGRVTNRTRFLGENVLAGNVAYNHGTEPIDALSVT